MVARYRNLCLHKALQLLLLTPEYGQADAEFSIITAISFYDYVVLSRFSCFFAAKFLTLLLK